MAESTTVIPTPNLQSFFYEAVHDIARKHKFNPPEEVLAYIINMLTRFGNADQIKDSLPARGAHYKTMVEHISEAFDASSSRQAAAQLAYTGDAATFIGGYLYHGFVRRPVDVDYYTNMAQRSYSTAAGIYAQMHTPQRALGETLEAMAENLPQVVDVLHEIGTNPNNPADILRLCELHLKTGSNWALRTLIGNGVMPAANSVAYQHSFDKPN